MSFRRKFNDIVWRQKNVPEKFACSVIRLAEEGDFGNASKRLAFVLIECSQKDFSEGCVTEYHAARALGN
jgi:hypothetical protein